MKLESVKVALPSRKVSNEDIVELIGKHSIATFEGNLDKTLDNILFYLKYSGSQNRNWLGDGETPIGLLTQAVNEALAEAKCDKSEIDLLIYTGIDRGFIEPGGSYMVAHSLGMNEVHCFDILDACMSWTRAIYIIYTLLQTGAYKRALVVNSEFNLRDDGYVYPKVFSLKNEEQINWSFPGYTLGEAATATVITYEPNNPWEFNFSSRADLADLCTVPLESYQKYYSSNSPKVGLDGFNRFTSFGNDLHLNAAKELKVVLEKLKAPLDEAKIIFPHASSKKAWDDVAEICGIKHLMWHIYPTCGNLVSASVPGGMATAIQQGKIQRGDRIIGWVGSAGMSFCSYSFIY